MGWRNRLTVLRIWLSSNLDALKELQPNGPYILIGYSFGGLVALEMAQRLSEARENIALLVLVDAYPHPPYLSPRQRLRLIVQRTRRHINEMKQMSAGGAISYLIRGLDNRLHLAGIHSRGARLSATSRFSFAQTTLRVKERAYRAFARYQPRVYGGKISFVKSEKDSYFPADPAPVWSNLAAEFESRQCPAAIWKWLRRSSKTLPLYLPVM
jgi:acetoacetyl-CoA synthetase